MNQKNSLGIDHCFGELDDPFKLFEEWFNQAKKTEINDPNALALGTSDKEGNPSVRMVLLKDFSQKGFIFYTSQSSTASVRPFTGSRVGINSCPTNALYLISSNAFIIGG